LAIKNSKFTIQVANANTNCHYRMSGFFRLSVPSNMSVTRRNTLSCLARQHDSLCLQFMDFSSAVMDFKNLVIFLPKPWFVDAFLKQTRH